jgi:hypothetical protein
MVVVYHLSNEPPDATTIVSETDDGHALFAEVAHSSGRCAGSQSGRVLGGRP